MAGESEYYDAGAIISSLEEKIESLKEKINLLARSLIEIKEEFDKRIEKIEKENMDLKLKVESVKRKADSIFEETTKFVKKEDLILIERMLKDFQPLEFIRRKDLEEYLEKIKNKEN
ncbi:MAG: hypothetical protein QXX68_02085 [Candidatus Pacearchaeota archaeon]